MDNKAYERIAIIVPALGGVAVVVNMIISEPHLRSAEAAAWVQAIGSIAAIVAAFLIPMYQHKKSEKAADEAYALERIQQLKALRLLIVASSALINKAHEVFQSGDRGVFDHYFTVLYSPGSLQEIAEVIGQFQFPALASDVCGILFIKKLLVQLDDYLKVFKSGRFTDADYRNMVERLDKDRRYIAKLIEELDAAVGRQARRITNSSRVAAAINLGDQDGLDI